MAQAYKLKLIFVGIFLGLLLINFVSAQLDFVGPPAEDYVPPQPGSAKDSVNGFFANLQQNDIVRFIVGDFRLVKSELKKDGPIYTDLKVYPLGE